MFSKEDIAILEGMFEKQEKRLEHHFDIKLQNLRIDLQDQTHSLISASEKRIISQITDFIANSIIPQIDEYGLEIGKIKHHLKLA